MEFLIETTVTALGIRCAEWGNDYTLLCHTAVSYTHLDVYKRQAYARPHGVFIFFVNSLNFPVTYNYVTKL